MLGIARLTYKIPGFPWKKYSELKIVCQVRLRGVGATPSSPKWRGRTWPNGTRDRPLV